MTIMHCEIVTLHGAVYCQSSSSLECNMQDAHALYSYFIMNLLFDMLSSSVIVLYNFCQ